MKYELSDFKIEKIVEEGEHYDIYFGIYTPLGKDAVCKATDDTDLSERLNLEKYIYKLFRDNDIKSPKVYSSEFNKKQSYLISERFETYIPDRNDWLLDTFRNEFLQNIQNVLKQIHSISHEYPVELQNVMHDRSIQFDWIESEISGEAAKIYDKYISVVESLWNRIEQNKNITTIHGDFFLQNIAISKNGQVRIFDCEKSGYGEPARDYASIEVCLLDEIFEALPKIDVENTRKNFREIVPKSDWYKIDIYRMLFHFRLYLLLHTYPEKNSLYWESIGGTSRKSIEIHRDYFLDLVNSLR